MSLQTSSHEKPVEGFLSSLMEAHPEASTRDIAVLFTDLVGSTKYFKKYGDMKGRAMLRKHHAIATSIVGEYGGSLVKEVGDSVMVYFPDCINALKAAIKMQHKFQAYNKDTNIHHEIHVRIGIHFGKVIFEEKDIYGDVVNVAAKLTNLANGDQLFISREVHDLTKDLPEVHFELMNFWNVKSVPTGLTIYKVIWESSPVLEPEKISILYLRPIKAPDGNNAIWKTFLENKSQVLASRHQLEQNLLDGTIVLAYKDSSAALSTAESLLNYFSEDSNKKGAPGAKAPLQIILDRNVHPKEMKLQQDKAALNTDSAQAGFIYMTKAFYENIKLRRLVSVEPSPETHPATPLFQFIRETSSQDKLRKQTPVSGGRKLPLPCFYCGSKTHYATDCPSKTLTDHTHNLNDLGRFSAGRIKMVTAAHPGFNPAGNSAMPPMSQSDLDLADNCFYEMKNINQLRSFRAIWGSRSDEWDKAKRHHTESEGGFSWLALDSFRVSNHERAEAYLKSAFESDKKDFKAHCVAGFINIEKEELTAAMESFERAFELAKTIPQKIFILFQQQRIYTLQRKIDKSQEVINKILTLDGGCTEARYEDIVHKFREKQGTYALQKLTKLIREYREYFIIALIDPDLEADREDINKTLEKIYEETKSSALRSIEEATANIESMTGTLRNKDLEEIESLKARIAELTRSESYFAYLEIHDICSSILTICNNALYYQKRDLSERTSRIYKRIEKNLEFIKFYKYKQFSDPVYKELKGLKTRINGLERSSNLFSSVQFNESHAQCDYISEQLNTIEQKLKKLDLMQQLINMIFNFMKTSCILFAVVFFTGIFIFPFFADSIGDFLAKLDIASSSNVWSMQKTFLIFGGIVSVVISFLLTIKNVARDQSPLIK